MLGSCHKKKEEQPAITTYKYTIKIDNNHRVHGKYKICSLQNNCSSFSQSFSFSKDSVIETLIMSDNYSTSIYYLNSNGLADSSSSRILAGAGSGLSIYKTYYYYNQDGNLIKMIGDDGMTTYEYQDGNLISKKNTINNKTEQTDYTYSIYSTLADYNSFIGAINKNLVQTETVSHAAIKESSTTYQYTIGSTGLVEKMNSTIYESGTQYSYITEYEYIMVNK